MGWGGSCEEPLRSLPHKSVFVQFAPSPFEQFLDMCLIILDQKFSSVVKEKLLRQYHDKLHPVSVSQLDTKFC